MERPKIISDRGPRIACFVSIGSVLNKQAVFPVTHCSMRFLIDSITKMIKGIGIIIYLKCQAAIIWSVSYIDKQLCVRQLFFSKLRFGWRFPGVDKYIKYYFVDPLPPGRDRNRIVPPNRNQAYVEGSVSAWLSEPLMGSGPSGIHPVIRQILVFLAQKEPL